jgi:hypothetical protein
VRFQIGTFFEGHMGSRPIAACTGTRISATPLPPLRHSRSSAYVQLSRVCHSSQNRLLLLDPGARALLENVQHREELLVFEEAYGPDGVFDPELALGKTPSCCTTAADASTCCKAAPTKAKCSSLSSCGSGKVKDSSKDNTDCAGTTCTTAADASD